MTWNGSSRAPQESLLPALATDTKESRSTSPCSMKTSNLSSSSLASSSPKATPSSSWVLSAVSARRRATRSSKSGHTSTRSGTARSPRGGFLKTQRHTLPRFIVVGFERSVSVGRAGAYNVSVLPFCPYSSKCLEGEFSEVLHSPGPMQRTSYVEYQRARPSVHKNPILPA